MSSETPALLHYAEEEGILELVNSDSELDQAIPPVLADLVRIHKLVRSRQARCVLEFGVGFSTLVIADALEKNRLEAAELIKSQPSKNGDDDFSVTSVDASRYWLDRLSDRIPASLENRIRLAHSEVEISQFQGQVCHFFQKLPDLVPDFIYLDGPDPKQVTGSIRGISFQNPVRTPLAADILLLESTLLPSAFILVDGRTNNARFLARNLKREYRISWDRASDVTSFELIEDPLR